MLHFPPDVYIVDSTLRSLQSGVSGSRHSTRDLIDIGIALDELGVREIIVNLSWKGGLAACEGLAAARGRAKLVGTFRARHPRAERLAIDGIAAGVHEICFESAHDGDHLARLVDVVRAREKRVSHAFAEKYSYDEVIALCRVGATLGVQSQSFHDSFFAFGLTPEGARSFYRRVLVDIPECPPLYVHLSNIYGGATMTAVAALAAGATAADVSMNGIGHHSGHISLAEIALVLENLYGVHTGIRLERLRDVSLLVRERTGIPVPPFGPVTGDHAFLTDGAYWAAEAHLPERDRVHAKFPIPPRLVGHDEVVIWSDNTITEESIKARLDAMHLDLGDVDGTVIDHIAADLRGTLQRRTHYPRWLTDAEFVELCRRAVEYARQGGAGPPTRSDS